MPHAALADPVLTRFRAAVDAAYGARVERVVLFGSRARGDARADSDYDIAVFLRDMADRWHELGVLAEITTDVLYQTGEVISAMAFAAGTWRDTTGFMRELRRDGIDL